MLGDHALLHTRSRPQAWPEWAQAHGLAPEALRFGTEFEHLVYLLEAAAAGLGIAIAPQPLVAADLAAGRLLAPWDSPPRMAAGYCAPPSATPIHASNGWPAGWVEHWRQTSTPLRP